MIENRKASFNYQILEKFEAGIQLTGGEIKSLRKNSASINDAFVRVKGNSAFLENAYIAPYQAQESKEDSSKRERRLLLHHKEIDYLRGKITSENLTVVPLKVYFKGNLVKIEIGLARGKREFEKRDSLKKKAIQRDVEETLREDKLKTNS